ncbi:complex I NDUFA9 subunit family protein [Sphingomonas nostoxanthinifaciens]|uniref:complex I NDUFA9 subunit family protein n=1 Tax=Sphingomonas nostoxanthinifaciens TaxID=2872652 RepID=UPI001CC1E280|nr:complex I NDUFA9 subunit family protein [Sphingomonas nostoxanthinifaciens]UAK25439.1 complex I NDUFA9 subunit family protein [Sphingomonas nostoxanthinifaciens]
MDELVTLIGGGGFLGRYVAQELLAAGARVRIAERYPADAWYLKPLGPLGQVQFVPASLTKPDSIARAVSGATAVVNLVGVLKGPFQALHVDGARTAAAAARAAGVRAFVQISAIGADPAADSAYARTKGEGERAVRDAFPDATIVRPSILFGPEDQFVNRFAQMISLAPVVPVVRAGAKFQPAWVSDVARAIAQAALDPQAHAGKTYELGGPQILSMGELNAWIAQAIGRKLSLPAVPDALAGLAARMGGWLPGAPMTWDQWLMLQRDNVVTTGAPGFADFGIAPAPLAAVAPRWLVRFRRHGRFSLGAA